MGEKPIPAVLFIKRDQRVGEHPVDRLGHVILLGERDHVWLHQRRDIGRGDWQVFENLQDRHRLGHRHRKRVAREPLPDPVDPLHDMRVALLDIPLHRVVERDSGGQLAHRRISQRRLSGGSLDEHLLNHLDGRPKTEAPGLLG